MLRTIRVYSGGTAKLGVRVARQGFEGDVDILENAVTITLIKPGASLGDVIRSLEIVIQGIELRIKQDKKE